MQNSATGGLESTLTWRAALLEKLANTVQLAPAVGRHGHGCEQQAHRNVPALGRVVAAVAAPLAFEISNGIDAGAIVYDHHRLVVLGLCSGRPDATPIAMICANSR